MMDEKNLISAMEYGAYIKKALSIAVNVGCGFEGDAEDAAKLLSLITFHESRIAELEAESERFTVHSDIERQDDKSPNDTQSQTIVYGKEDSEDK